jgi:uncharacterized protein
MYRDGEGGTPQDYKQALYWYTKAAENKSSFSQNIVALMHSRGEGTPQNFVIAYAWFSVAAAAEQEDAKENRELIEGKMTPSQIEKGQKLFKEYALKYAY